VAGRGARVAHGESPNQASIFDSTKSRPIAVNTHSASTVLGSSIF